MSSSSSPKEDNRPKSAAIEHDYKLRLQSILNTLDSISEEARNRTTVELRITERSTGEELYKWDSTSKSVGGKWGKQQEQRAAQNETQ